MEVTKDSVRKSIPMQGKYQNKSCASVATIELAAVGRMAILGELYDARRDNFLHLSLFKSNLPKTSITSTHNKQTKMQYASANSMEEKFETMGISGELRLSILAGLFELEGSGKLFKDTKRSEKTAKVSLINSIWTEYEQISLTSSDVQSVISTSALEQTDCTHVVVGIQWGANVFISVEDNNCEEKDQEKNKGSLMSNFQKLTQQISAKFDAIIDENHSKELNKYSFEIFGDILPEEEPQNLIEAVKFIKNVPGYFRMANNGKGKAIKYSLIPISWIRKLMNSSEITNLAIRHVDDAAVKCCVRLFDDFNKFESKLNDLVDEVDKYQKYIATPKIKKVQNSKLDFQVFQAQIQNKLSENLFSVRSGNKTVEELHNTITGIKTSNNPYFWENNKFQIFELIKEEILFIKLMINLNVTILPKDRSFKMFLSENYDKDIYLLFYTDELWNEIEKPMHLFREILQRRSQYGDNALFTVAKIENLDKTPSDQKSSRLCLYRKGQLIQNNFESDSSIPDITRQIRFLEEVAKIDVLVDDYPSDSFSNDIRRVDSNSVFDAFRDLEQEARWTEQQMVNDTPVPVAAAASKRRTLEDLFRPPLDLICRGTLQYAKDEGQRHYKWLMVNVQNHQEFMCQVLNRDVWNNPTVKSIIKEHFIFWQTYPDNSEGQRFVQFHNVTNFPYIAILDPRTGDKLRNWNAVDSVSFCDLVTEFLHDFPSQSGTSGLGEDLNLIPDTTAEKAIYEESEEMQLKAAVATSLQQVVKTHSNANNQMTNEVDDSDLDI